MADPLSWLDTLPDLRVASVVSSVHEAFPEAVHTTAHHCTPDGVHVHTAENRHSTPCTPENRVEWGALATRTGQIGRWAGLLQARAKGMFPNAISPARWRELLVDAHRFLTRWGDQALAMGWVEADLFAVPPGPEGWGRAGLVALLHGRPVAAITTDAITIANPSGEPNRYRRSENAGHVLLWQPEAYMEAGNGF